MKAIQWAAVGTLTLWASSAWAGFSAQPVVLSADFPVALAFAPDGQLYFTTPNGIFRLIHSAEP